MPNEIKAGVYEHYTGLMVLVLGLARHSETEEKFIVYVPLGAKKGPRLTIRPAVMFFEDVEINAQTRPRFRHIAPEMPADLAENYEHMHGWGYPGRGPESQK